MTKPNTGKPDTKTHKCELATAQRNLITIRLLAQGISIGLGVCLTIYLGIHEQYLNSLFALTLTIAATTSDRLRKIRIGLKGMQSEWRDPPK